jgi:uncharacterized protein YycO
MARVQARIERYGPGEHAELAMPGDFVLTHRRHRIMPVLISLAQRRHWRGPRRPYAHWSHAALVVGEDGALVEAEANGVIRSSIAKYRPQEYHLVRMDAMLDGAQRAAARDAGLRSVGEAFGYLVMAGLALWLLTGIRVRFRRRHHQICSGLVAGALEAAGQRLDRDPSFILPADLAELYRVVP